jgi:hypothetical protein
VLAESIASSDHRSGEVFVSHLILPQQLNRADFLRFWQTASLAPSSSAAAAHLLPARLPRPHPLNTKNTSTHIIDFPLRSTHQPPTFARTGALSVAAQHQFHFLPLQHPAKMASRKELAKYSSVPLPPVYATKSLVHLQALF